MKRVYESNEFSNLIVHKTDEGIDIFSVGQWRIDVYVHLERRRISDYPCFVHNEVLFGLCELIIGVLLWLRFLLSFDDDHSLLFDA